MEETVDFRFIKANGKPVVVAIIGTDKVGALRLVPYKDSYQVDSVLVKDGYRRVGIGKELYRSANDKLPKGLYSDQNMSPDAKRIWDSFIKSGEAKKTEDNRYIMVKESKMKKYDNIKALLEASTLVEGEKTAFVNGKPAEYTDRKELDKLKDNSDIESIETADGQKIKEAEGVEFSQEETQAIAREVGRALALALREVGEEIDSAKIHNVEPNSFEIFIKYKNDFEDDFSFYIDQDTLHMTDFSFDKEIGEVGVKPSGEAIVHKDVLKNNMVKHFQALNEEDDEEEEFRDDDLFTQQDSDKIEYGIQEEEGVNTPLAKLTMTGWRDGENAFKNSNYPITNEPDYFAYAKNFYKGAEDAVFQKAADLFSNAGSAPDELNEEESPQKKYIRMMNIYKNASGEKRKEMKPLLQKAAKAVSIKLDLDEKCKRKR